MRKVMTVVLSFCLVFAPLVTFGASYKERSISELLEISDSVLVVKIVSAKKTYIGEDLCGVKYTANVISSLKGSDEGRITFGKRLGLAVGSKYLVFLKNYNSIKEYRQDKYATPEIFDC
jgi:hypothetical protein